MAVTVGFRLHLMRGGFDAVSLGGNGRVKIEIMCKNLELLVAFRGANTYFSYGGT